MRAVSAAVFAAASAVSAAVFAAASASAAVFAAASAAVFAAASAAVFAAASAAAASASVDISLVDATLDSSVISIVFNIREPGIVVLIATTEASIAA